MGFLLAATLINDSFQNWKEYPIKTTVESMAMKELIFPNITVCPPRDHFRNINYDLRQYKKLDFNMDTRNELLQSSLNILQQYIYKELLQNMSKVNDVRKVFKSINKKPKRLKSCNTNLLARNYNRGLLMGVGVNGCIKNWFDGCKPIRRCSLMMNNQSEHWKDVLVHPSNYQSLIHTSNIFYVHHCVTTWTKG